jgi:hypothetical protein
MRYEETNAGRIVEQASGGGSFYTWDEVQARLVEAVETWWRMPDPDARFGLSGRISSIWRQFIRDRELRALVDAETEEPRRPRPSRADIGRMQEASDWIAHVGERDRPLLIMSITCLAAGDKRVPWEKLWKHFGRGRPGPDGLRKRYDGAITAIANCLNSASEQG